MGDLVDVKAVGAAALDEEHEERAMVGAAHRLGIPTSEGSPFRTRWREHAQVRQDLARAVADDGWDVSRVGPQSPAAR